MTRVRVDAPTPRTLVWVGDSKSYSSGALNLSAPWQRWGDLHARDLCASGAIRYRDGWDHNDGVLGTWGDEPRDLVYRSICEPGVFAHTWPDSSRGAAVPSDAWDSPIDWLVVQFGGNDYNSQVGASTFYDGLVDRLNEWTNVRRKLLFMGTVNGNPTGAGPWARATGADAQDYWDAAAQAAADADPGDRQSVVRFRSLFGLPYLLTDNGSTGALADWTYDRTHLVASGARRYWLDFRRAFWEG